MARIATTIIADNIVSPLGLTSAANYAAVKSGRSALTLYEGMWNVPHPFMASFIDRDEVEEEVMGLGLQGAYTFFEKIVILSISMALAQCAVDASSPRTLFVLSTTKGNVDLLRANKEGVPAERIMLGAAAAAIARHFGNSGQPIVVSNACISGVSAQITATRLLQAGLYDNAIVCGAEMLSEFIISGFQSLMALTDEPCRPFDAERNGINLGEAAATIIYSNQAAGRGAFEAVHGAVRNDANHISNPSKTAEGCYRCLRSVMANASPEELAFVNAHGTATLYNDEMEAKALDRAGLLSVPVNSLKGYYGHTMGAAGVLETVISMRAVSDNTILGTRGYESSGVSRRINISAENKPTDKQAFVKLISGFGGCNAAMLFRRKEGAE